MPSLKTFRLRIRSVQSTQKITKAMKMVAAAKLRRAQEQATAARPYAEAMDRILASLGHSFKGGTGPRLLAGTGSDKVHLLIVATGWPQYKEIDPAWCKRTNGHRLTVLDLWRTLPIDKFADVADILYLGSGR